jgi:hypothetical protein
MTSWAIPRDFEVVIDWIQQGDHDDQCLRIPSFVVSGESLDACLRLLHPASNRTRGPPKSVSNADGSVLPGIYTTLLVVWRRMAMGHSSPNGKSGGPKRK